MYSKKCIPGVILILLVGIIGSIADQSIGPDEAAPLKVTIADILSTPDKYSGSNLSVEGKISSQCGSGCWFIISDETGDLYVNLNPNNFVIPPSMGRAVVVNGTILEKNGDVAFIGSSVSVEGKFYP
jgi:hypothetical protein